MPEESVRSLEGLEVLILDALRYTPHPTHFSVSEALTLIERVKPKRAILTNLHTDLDYETLRRELPPHIEPAYDGLQIEALLMGRRTDRYPHTPDGRYFVVRGDCGA